MNYLKLSVNIKSEEDWFHDVFTFQLFGIGFESFMETDYGFDAFIPENDFDESALKKLLSQQPENVEITWSKAIIEEKNWNEEWEKNYFEPLKIGEDCVIRAPFHQDFPHAKYEIIIEPNMAFGTGNHETTSMMLETILENDIQDKTLLDMGCGTGILGILASMRGAKKITAIDIDEWSFKGASENAQINHIENMEVKLGDASLLGGEKYDVIFANIHKNVLLNDLPIYSNCLKTSGQIFISGFYTEDIPELINKAELVGLKKSDIKSKNSWVVLILEKMD